jgi:hypothetical protein
MRRPAQHRTGPAAPGWAHPYTGIPGIAVFYNDGGNPPTPPAGDPNPAPQPPKPGPPVTPTVSMTQDELTALAAKEKDQGKRAGARQALEDLAKEMGFTKPDDIKAFVDTARQAQQDALSEEEKRKQELEKREQAVAEREIAAIARERAASRRATLVGLGATGDDLEDAAALLRVEDDADEQTVRDAAEKLKERRPELFGATPTPQTNPLPPAPGGAPATGQRPGGTSHKPGDAGREMLRRRGKLRDTAA